VSDATTKLLSGQSDGAPSLLVITSEAPTVVPIADGKEIRIGRGSNADIVIDDSSLSRLHAVFRMHDGVLEVEDLDSSNGTTLRGARAKPGVPIVLAIGDTVHLGAVLVVVQVRSGSVADRLRPSASAGTGNELVGRVAASTISVLLLGETGVGKEVMAERLHALSPRKERPLVKLNCAALMASVLESELFGHEKGAFTGAVKDKPGLVESADGGTLFLDEIGEADLSIQTKLLRVLESRETQRIGALRPRIVDVRFIAATNRVPAEQIARGTLRADLYYRLAGFTITIPPLRDRMHELPALATELLARHGAFTLEPKALARLHHHAWPGNVRELRNVLDRAVVLTDSPRITAQVIETALAAEPLAHVATPAPAAPAVPPAPSVEDPERARILGVLEQCGGNQSVAAEKLGMSRRALVYRLQAWGLTKYRRGRE
jgi:two-component system response regulator AtoC